jgi:hypothetical protein
MRWTVLYARSVSEYSEIVFQKYNGLCATWNHATTYSTKSDYSDTLLASRIMPLFPPSVGSLKSRRIACAVILMNKFRSTEKRSARCDSNHCGTCSSLEIVLPIREEHKAPVCRRSF